MRGMRLLLAVFLLVFIVSFPGIGPRAQGDDATYKKNLEKIAQQLGKSGEPGDSETCVVFGDIEKGYAERTCMSSLEEAQKECKENCAKKSGNCEELLTTSVRNNTKKKIRLFFFRPNTFSYAPKNALYTYELDPEDELILSVGGNALYLTKSFFMGAKVVNGDEYWVTRKLGDYVMDTAILKKNRRMAISLILTK